MQRPVLKDHIGFIRRLAFEFSKRQKQDFEQFSGLPI